MTDLSQLERDLATLDKDIKSREERIAFYEKHGLQPQEFPYAYVFNFPLDVPANILTGVSRQLPVQERTVQVKKDTIFFVKSIGQAFTVVGTRAGDITQEATITLPPTTAQLLFNYRFKIRDTGSDREWMNTWVPGAMLLTGNYNSFRLRRGHALCSPGSEVTVTIDPKVFGNDPAYTNLSSISGQQLQIVLSGFEVPFKGGA